MIYSKKLQTYIPITISKTSSEVKDIGKFTKYIVKDNKIPVGYVNLIDTPRGVKVSFIKNEYPDLYRGFGKIADLIEVQHCMNRGLDSFEIESQAALNSHALHYKRGKRFFPEKFNDIVKTIIEKTPKGEKYNTSYLGKINMYMPQKLIEKYTKFLQKSPLFKEN